MKQTDRAQLLSSREAYLRWSKLRIRLRGFRTTACILSCVVTVANGQEKQKPIDSPKVSQSKRTRAVAADPRSAEAAPCPRGTWKDDPVCFGEGATDTLPTPSAGSVANTSSSTSGPTLKPTANINPRPVGPGPYQGGVVYQSNGNAVTSNYGAGVKMELPF